MKVAKKEKGLWDFDDLSVTVLKLFTENKRVLEKYRRMFKYILVDESRIVIISR